MSPTLLELTVAVLLLWVAWQIGVLIAPRVFASLLSFWRNGNPPPGPDRWPPEKNITPPPARDEIPRKKP